MKKLKSKLFYINAIIFYFILLLISVIFSSVFIEQYANGMLISKFASNIKSSSNIVEVVVDDFSIQKYAWPWEKDKLADLLDYFHSYAKAKVVGFDFIPQSFETVMSPSEKKFISQVGKMNNLVTGFIPEILHNNDDEEILKDFSKRFSLDTELKTNISDSPYDGVKIASNALRLATKNYGTVITDPAESSGYLIDFTNVIKIGDSFYPSLALKMYMYAHNTNKISIDGESIFVPDTGLKIKYNYYEGTFSNLIRYYKPYGNISNYTYPVISASKILDTYTALSKGITPQKYPELYDTKKSDCLIDPAYFNNKAVFIGGNMSGPSADVLKTPMQIRHPGVDILATIYNNFENNDSLNIINFWTSLFIFIVLIVSAYVLIMKTKFLKGLVSIITLDFVYLCIVFVSANNGYLMSYATPIFCQFMTAVFAYSFKFLSESRNKEMIKNAMGKYISQDVMKDVVKNIEDLKLGGKRAIVTVLFSDIRGFTSLSEKMSAEEVSVILNEYFSEMEPIIRKYNGVINKFIGDAVMAIFGEPIQDINHPQNAVKCAYDMLKKVEYLREKWLFEGKPKIEIGIGINTGEVFIGNIGTETRMEYTVIGDTVNLASRIESYNKVYKTNLLVSSTTYNYISEIADVIKIKEVQIRGKAKKMDIYEVLRIDK